MTTASAEVFPASGTNGTFDPSAVKPPFFDINGKKPIHYGVLLFPGFQALDVFGPLDVFNSLSMLYHFPTKLTMLAADGSPVETSHQRAGNQMFSHPETNVSQSLIVDRTFQEQLDIQQAGAFADARGGAIDVLIVPGGVGTRNDMDAEIEFVREIYPDLKALLCVCTGATILARAGVLDGRRATTNKRAYTWATSTGPNVKWVAEARWVVDGNIVTGSGISAGIDATYAFVGLNYGETIAQELADSAEYVRWTDPDHDPFAKRWNAGNAFRFFFFSLGYLDPALLFSFSTFLPTPSMQRRQQQKPTPDARFSNLEPLLLVIRKELGLDWCFYKEFLECFRTAILKGEDTSIWVHHIEPLVQEPALQFAHQGVLFLLREMLRSKPPPSTNMVSPSPLPSGQPPLSASPTSDVQPNFIGGHAPIASPLSAVNTRPPPSSSPANQLQRYRALDQAPAVSLCFDRRGPPAFAPTNMSRLPAPPMASFSFDYSKPLKQQPVSANFSLPSADSVAFSGEERRITVEPLKSAYSGGFVLHQDPAFRQDIQEFFGHKYPTGKSETKYYSQKDVPPVYKAADDDLAVWRADGGTENVGNDSGGEGCLEDRMKSLEDRSRENLLERLRYKLFNE